jgi:hypothetical protein
MNLCDILVQTFSSSNEGEIVKEGKRGAFILFEKNHFAEKKSFEHNGKEATVNKVLDGSMYPG